MFNRKSIYALNKKDPNAIVYTDDQLCSGGQSDPLCSGTQHPAGRIYPKERAVQ